MSRVTLSNSFAAPLHERKEAKSVSRVNTDTISFKLHLSCTISTLESEIEASVELEVNCNCPNPVLNHSAFLLSVKEKCHFNSMVSCLSEHYWQEGIDGF